MSLAWFHQVFFSYISPGISTSCLVGCPTRYFEKNSWKTGKKTVGVSIGVISKGILIGISWQFSVGIVGRTLGEILGKSLKKYWENHSKKSRKLTMEKSKEKVSLNKPRKNLGRNFSWKTLRAIPLATSKGISRETAEQISSRTSREIPSRTFKKYHGRNSALHWRNWRKNFRRNAVCDWELYRENLRKKFLYELWTLLTVCEKLLKKTMKELL